MNEMLISLGRNHARERAPPDHSVFRPGKTCCDGAGAGRSDGSVRGDDPARHCGAALAKAPAPRARWRGGNYPAAVCRPCGPPVPRERDNYMWCRNARLQGRRSNFAPMAKPVIINGGTTTWQMVNFLHSHRLQVFTNSFPIAEHLLHHSKNTVMVSGGMIYREQNIILSPFDNDVTRNFYAQKMFMGAQGHWPARPDGGRPAAHSS